MSLFDRYFNKEIDRFKRYKVQQQKPQIHHENPEEILQPKLKEILSIKDIVTNEDFIMVDVRKLSSKDLAHLR